MTSLVSFDSKGPFGPAMTLIFNTNYYTADGILEIANLLKANFKKLTGTKVKGKKEFCAAIISAPMITPTGIMSTRFFQNMQNRDSPHHELVLKGIVPLMLKSAKEYIPASAELEEAEAAEFSEWTAKFLESYMTEEQIVKHAALQSTMSSQIIEERKRLGQELYGAAIGKTFTDPDLDRMVHIARSALAEAATAEHMSSTLHFTGKYLTLFAMNQEDPAALGTDILGLLSTVFRDKMFPKTEEGK